MRISLALTLMMGLLPVLSWSDDSPSLEETVNYIGRMVAEYGSCEWIEDGEIRKRASPLVQLWPSWGQLAFEERRSNTNILGGTEEEVYNYFFEFDPNDIGEIFRREDSSPCLSSVIYLGCRVDGEKLNNCVTRKRISSDFDTEFKRAALFIELSERDAAKKIEKALRHYWSLKGIELETREIDEDLFE